MCCLFLVAALLGPRALAFIWWLLEPARWGATFPQPLFGIIGWLVVPWTTLAYTFLLPGGIEGLDWVVIVVALFVDLGTNGGGAFNRDRRPKLRES
jgi:hypothetical protein